MMRICAALLEPNVETTYERFRALEILHDNGIPTVVWLARYCLYK